MLINLVSIFILILIICLIIILCNKCNKKSSFKNIKDSNNFLFTSSYIKIPNPRKNAKYDNFFKNTLVVKANYNIYGSKEFINEAYNIRKDNGYLTYTNELSFENLKELSYKYFNEYDILSKLQKDSIDKYKNLNSNLHCVSNNLLFIWITKLLLVKLTIIKYPNFKIYGWIDAGYTSYRKGNKKIPNKPFPTNNINNIDLNKLYVNRYDHACHPFYYKDNYNLKQCPIGGFFYGSKKVMNKFIDSYIEIVKKHLKNNISLCTEQDLFEIVIQKYNIPIYDFNKDTYELIFI